MNIIHKRLTFEQRRKAIKALQRFVPGMEEDQQQPPRRWTTTEVVAYTLAAFFATMTVITLATYLIGTMII